MKEETAKVMRCPFKLSNSDLTEKGHVLCDGSACMAWVHKPGVQDEGDCGMLTKDR